MKRFENLETGVIYNVTNEGLLNIYEDNPKFREIKEKPVKKKKDQE